MAPVLRSSQNIETAFFQTRPMTEAEKADAARKREVRCRDILLKGPIEELSQRTQNRYKRYWKAVDILAEGENEADQKFQERTLWHFFDCMVDAISVLNEVFEYAYDRATQKAVRPAVAYSVWYPYVHLDAKLRNWFVKIDPTTLSNPAMPVLKHANSGDDGIVGKFGPATNVWALGLNMVLLAELKEAHEDGAHNSQGIRTTGLEKANPEPILPNFQIDGRQADGRTYCLSLRDEAYSDELKDLIFQCLYEKPALRPTCQETKQRIGLALDRIYPKEGPKHTR
ncbi:hypothetical protein M7I_1034 [Glarea lozoyensis 74030]|uniref:Protein kinase domain-containing protein n=1 Tax=Glarea lozoyensis (strain ATCC 74030 / MF5533) TaxID=1104152 RepID=H0EEZ7_GLAL7|nr:hypothetical protein M7I_1034 [Glarea lozoyensis 74030]